MLKLKNICKNFNADSINSVNVFSNLNLEIEKGSFVTIIGGNGAGKSTLLNLIAGHYFPDQGRIFLNEKDITRLKEYQRARWIGRVFQNPLAGTAPELTIAENLALTLNKGKPLSLKRAFFKKDLDKFKEILKTVNLGLEDKLNLPVKFLSGGQRQALTLLMAVATSPQLLLLDEHTAALDPKTAHEVMELTNKLVHRKSLTTLMVTHNLEQAVRYGDRLIMLYQGEIILDLKGKEKGNLTPGALLARFQASGSKVHIEDRLLFA